MHRITSYNVCYTKLLRIALFTEHLSWCGDEGHLYDLLPIPFVEEAVMHVAGRIRRTQEILERRIAVENASYYVARITSYNVCYTKLLRARKRGVHDEHEQ